MTDYSTTAFIPQVTVEQVTTFFLTTTDKQYAAWWPGTHLAFRALSTTDRVVGSRVYFDEWVGTRRLRFKALVSQYEQGKCLEYTMVYGIRLPAKLKMSFEQTDQGVEVAHSLCVGCRGLGVVFDPLIRLFLGRRFEHALNDHARIEFLKLGEVIGKLPVVENAERLASNGQ